MGGFRESALKVQQMLIDAGAEVDFVKVPAASLEPGVQRIDVIIKNEDEVAQQNPDLCQGAGGSPAMQVISKLLSSEFGPPNGGGAWDGLRELGAAVMIGIDRENGRPTVCIERHAYDVQEGQVTKSFKQFFIEARKSGIAYNEEKTKGVVVKVIATLEGHEAGKLTRVARQYHNILKALKKLEEKKVELNTSLKALVGDTFDPELDKYLTRVVASAQFAVTLAKETKPEDVAEKVEVQYDLLAEGLLKLLTDDLKPAGDALLAACTKRWKPDVKSPNLTVKKLDEGVVDTVRSWWRNLKDAVMTALLRFDKNLSKLEGALATYKKLPKPKDNPNH